MGVSSSTVLPSAGLHRSDTVTSCTRGLSPVPRSNSGGSSVLAKSRVNSCSGVCAHGDLSPRWPGVSVPELPPDPASVLQAVGDVDDGDTSAAGERANAVDALAERG